MTEWQSEFLLKANFEVYSMVLVHDKWHNFCMFYSLRIQNDREKWGKIDYREKNGHTVLSTIVNTILGYKLVWWFCVYLIMCISLSRAYLFSLCSNLTHTSPHMVPMTKGYAVTLNDACRSGVKVISHHSMILFKRMHVYFSPIWFILYINRA